MGLGLPGNPDPSPTPHLLEHKRRAAQRHRHGPVSMDARRQVLAHEVDARHGDELRVEAAWSGSGFGFGFGFGLGLGLGLV